MLQRVMRPLVIGCLVTAAAAAAAEPRTLRVGVWENRPVVFTAEDQRPAGIAIDVLNSLAAQERWRIEYIQAPWDEQLTALDAGSLDVVVGMAYSEERARRFRLSRESLLGNWGIVYQRPGSRILSPLDLRDRRVAMMRSSIHSRAFHELMTQFRIPYKALETDSYGEAMALAAGGKADAAVVNRLFGSLGARHYNLSETGIIFNPVYVHYAAPRNADPVVLDTLDRHLADLKADRHSAYYRSLERWLETNPTHRLPTWMTWMLGGLGGVLALAVAIAALLRVQVRRKTRELRRKASELENEVEQRRLAQDRLNQLAYYDALTGLRNREAFREQLQQETDAAAKRDARLAVLFIDIDRLKNINDSYGHPVGDLVIQRAAERLNGCLRSHDNISRFGGDEFVVLVRDMETPADAERVAHRLIHSLAAPIDIGVAQAYISVSIGIAVFPDDARSPEDLLKNADTAMYQAKGGGRNRYQFYNRAQTTAIVERVEAEMRLRRALDRNELVLHYQPVIDLRSGCIASVEALVRWNDPERGMIAPDRFIPLAEDTGLIVPIGDWVLERACMEIRGLRDAGHGELRLAVNVSMRQFERRQLVASVENALARSQLDAGVLDLEITEGLMLVLNEEVRQTLDMLRDLGAQFLIDDFGTGYSNLGYLQELPFHGLKIDRSFVRNLTTNAHDRNIASTILMMARGLELSTVAEGIETREQLDLLRVGGCDFGQGYLFGRPQPLDELTQTLNDPPPGMMAAASTPPERPRKARAARPVARARSSGKRNGG